MNPRLRQPRTHGVDVGTERVATHRELLDAGIPLSTITYRIQPGGPWQRLLPGVVLMHNGRPTTRERLLGALSFAGEDAVLTGGTALSLNNVRTATALPAHVLVPHERRRQSTGFVVIERTRELPVGADVHVAKGLPTTPLPRATVDACRRLADLGDVRNLVSDAVQNHGVAISELGESLSRAARQRTALGRIVLAEVGVGVRFAAEARAREVLRGTGAPEPLYNVEVVDDDGRVIAVPDGVWKEYACGYQIDSRRWHLSPASYEHTVANRAYAARFGLLLVPVTPQRVFEQPEAFLADVLGMLETASRRDVPVLHYRLRDETARGALPRDAA